MLKYQCIYNKIILHKKWERSNTTHRKSNKRFTSFYFRTTHSHFKILNTTSNEKIQQKYTFILNQSLKKMALRKYIYENAARFDSGSEMEHVYFF